jgi:hypothetical protein
MFVSIRYHGLCIDQMPSPQYLLELWLRSSDQQWTQYLTSNLLIYHNRVRGPMARRLTTNQEIAGSIPAVLIYFCRLARLSQSAVIFSFAALKHRWLLLGVWVVKNVDVEEDFWRKQRLRFTSVGFDQIEQRRDG